MTPERTEKLLKVLHQRQANLTLIMENVQDPHNISAVLRTCDAVGIQEVYVLSTELPKYKHFGYKSSSSAIKWLTIHEYHDVQKCVVDVRKKFKTILTTHLSSDAIDLHAIDFTESVALVFGNEVDGVDASVIALCDGVIEIPQWGMKHSLNISVAAAVVLWEFVRS